MIPDGEKLLSRYLREYAPLAAEDVRVVGKPPSDTEKSPWIRVTVLDAPSALPDHLVPFYFQLDVYATEEGGQPEAVQTALIVREALAELNRGASLPDGVVSGAEINGYARIPDTEFEPARERMMLTTTVYAHS